MTSRTLGLGGPNMAVAGGDWNLNLGPEGGGLSSGLGARQQTLNYLDRQFSEHHWNEGIRRQLQSLREETDPQIFDSDLFHIGQGLEQQNNLEAAVLVYSVFNRRRAAGSQEYLLPDVAGSLRERAEENIAVITGQGGSLGRRFEFQMNRFVEGATDPAMIAGMAIGSTVFTASRAMILPRLMGSSSRLWSTVPFLTRTAASALATVPEVGAFWGASKGIREFLTPGSTRWDWQTNLHELAGLGITLGFLKSSGFVFGRLGAWARTPAGTPALRSPVPEPSVFWQQGGMLTGIMLGHGTEMALGLRPRQDGAFFLMDSLIMLAQFNAGGALSQRVFPSLYGFNHRLGQQMALQEQTQMEGLVRPDRWKSWLENLIPNGGMELGLVTAMGPTGAGRGRDFLQGPQIHWMSGEGNEDGNGSGPRYHPDSIGHAPTLEGPVQPTPESPNPTLPGPPPRIPPSLPQTEDFESTEAPLSGPDLARQIAQDSFPPSSNGNGFHPGDRIGPDGKYEVIRHLGEGGMGAVYQVLEVEGLRRNAVIKVNKDARTMGRFAREYRIGANMTTSRKATVYELIEHNGITIPVMEFIPGRDLSYLIEGVRFQDPEILNVYPLEVRLEIFAKICEAVAEIHRDGVLHRDLKPENIRLTGWPAVLESRLRDAQEEERPDPNEIRALQELLAAEQGRPLDDVRIMDLGIATTFNRLMSNGDHDDSDSRQPSIIPPRLEEGDGVKTVEGAFLGTPGYIAPESIARDTFPSRNPGSGDLFALGVILYELATGFHPFAHYQEGVTGDPALVPQRLEGGITRMNLMGVLQLDGMRRVPSFEDIVINPEDFGPLFPEVEAVARRTMLPHPRDRYGSIEELRQAVLMLKSRLDFQRMQEIQQQRESLEGNLLEAWSNFKWGTPPAPELWRDMSRPMETLKFLRQDWLQRGENLVMFLTESMRGQSWPEAQRMIAQISWEQLLEGGDRLDPTTRQTLMERIRTHDVPTATVKNPTMRMAIDGTVRIDLQARDIQSGQDRTEDLQVSVIPLLPERDSNGVETGNFREGAKTFTATWPVLRNHLNLRAGYYAFEIRVPEYAPMRLPVQVGLAQVRHGYETQEPLRLDLDLVPSEQVPEGMVVIHQGEATLGHDFYWDGDVFTANSYPQRRTHFPTFLVTRDPISVGEYLEFIQDQINSGVPANEIKPLIPRSPQPSQARATFAKVRAAFTRVFKNEENFYWRLGSVGFGKNKRLVLEDPTSHTDPFGDPITLDQPISAITPFAAMEYARWRSRRDGQEYRLIRDTEKEKVDRNSLPWPRPWGYGPYDPSLAVGRLSFQDLTLATPQPIGSHPMGMGRDRTLFGTRDNVGNVREFTGTEIESDTYLIMGGSVRLNYGSYFNPSARFLVNLHVFQDSIGAFRLVKELSSANSPSRSED